MCCRKPPSRQRGVVLIVVLIVVALVALIATQISSRLLLSERRSTNLQHSDQAWQYVLGAESLAASHLKEALKEDKDKVHLGQAWAKGKFVFPIEGGQLSGEIIDMSTCFNVNSLLFKKRDQQGNPSDPQGGKAGDTPNAMPAGAQLLSKIFEQTLEDVEVTPEALSSTLIDWIDEDNEPFGNDGAEDYQYTALQLPYRVGNGPLGAISELRTIKGFDAEVYRAVRPFLCALPDVEYGRINMNTLPPERAVILAAMVDNLSVESARQVLESRPKNGFDSEADFWTAPGMPTDAKANKLGEDRISFTTAYFLVKAEAVVGRGRARVESLLKAEENQSFKVVSRSFAEE